MKTVILAGGFGTRLSEHTELLPKPMVDIGGKPIIWHIMNSYAAHGFNDFIIALGYKASVIKEYFLQYHYLNSDFTVDLATGSIISHQPDRVDWKVTLVDTGLEAMTGGRIGRLRPFIGSEPFLLTYGDGVSDLDIADLVRFHKSHGKMVTVTAVHPSARFGEIALEKERVLSFQEKPQIEQGWINGGYFVCEPKFLELISDDSTILERGPLETVAENGQLMAYRHEGFWQCMDTKRDRDYLEGLCRQQTPPWQID